MTYGRWHCGKTLALNQTHSADRHSDRDKPYKDNIGQHQSRDKRHNRSFSKLTGAGPTGLRIQHFIDAADVPLSCSILQSLKGVVNILVAGRAPPMIASFLAGGNLTALVKSMQDSSLDIRPIAVGEACGSIEKRWGLGGTEGEMGLQACGGGLDACGGGLEACGGTEERWD
ncbi:hypothetical protein EMCRGX_G030271 [Ephydatia muelleri]